MVRTRLEKCRGFCSHFIVAQATVILCMCLTSFVGFRFISAVENDKQYYLDTDFTILRTLQKGFHIFIYVISIRGSLMAAKHTKAKAMKIENSNATTKHFKPSLHFWMCLISSVFFLGEIIIFGENIHAYGWHIVETCFMCVILWLNFFIICTKISANNISYQTLAKYEFDKWFFLFFFCEK